MSYFKQTTKVIDISTENYNEINIDSFININVYINGILQQEKHFTIENNKIIFNKDILKDGDIIIIDYISDIETEQVIDDNVNRYEIEYNNDNTFLINPIKEDSVVNVYINGNLQNDNYEYIIENNNISGINILSELKDGDLISIECFIKN